MTTLFTYFKWYAGFFFTLTLPSQNSCIKPPRTLMRKQINFSTLTQPIYNEFFHHTETSQFHSLCKSIDWFLHDANTCR